MSLDEARIVETKLDILIQDFQRHRESQDIFNRDMNTRTVGDASVQQKILTTLKWHSVIGAGIIASLGALWLKFMGL